MIHLLIKLQLHLCILAIITPTGSGVVSMAHIYIYTNTHTRQGQCNEGMVWKLVGDGSGRQKLEESAGPTHQASNTTRLGYGDPGL